MKRAYAVGLTMFAVATHQVHYALSAIGSVAVLAVPCAIWVWWKSRTVPLAPVMPLRTGHMRLVQGQDGAA